MNTVYKTTTSAEFVNIIRDIRDGKISAHDAVKDMHPGDKAIVTDTFKVCVDNVKPGPMSEKTENCIVAYEYLYWSTN